MKENPSGIHLFFQRIFKRKNSDDQKAESFDDKFRTIVELAPDAFFHGDNNGNFILVNNKASELTGYSKEELLCMNMKNLFSDIVINDKPLRYDLLLKGKTIKSERKVKTKHGEMIDIEMNSRAMPDGTYQSFFRDITDRKKAEEEIRRSEARLRRAELASKSGNWELHVDTQTIIASEGASRIYGVPEELDFATVKKVPLPEYRPILDQAMQDLINEGKPYNLEFKIKLLEKDEIKDIHSLAVYDKEKNIVFGIIRDITDSKRVEEELINAKNEAEKSNKLKTAFLQNMSHEIRTPMNAIIGFSSLIADNIENPEKLIRYSKIIGQRSYDLLDIINDILDISQIESGQIPISKEECHISKLFESISTFFVGYQERLEKQYIEFSLHSEIDTENSVIITDKVKLKQILLNLLTNALKFTDAGFVKCGCYLENENIVFYVSDSGIGIPPEKQEAVFDRFVQLTQKKRVNAGTGLGLSIVKGLVGLLGGEIHVESEVGKGSTFKFSIPYVTAGINTKKVKKEAPVNFINNSDKTILIVEDDEFNAEYLKEIISGLGFNLLHAQNGKEAVEFALSNEVDIILMDIRLPDFDGYQATQMIREQKPNVVILAQTAYATSEERKKALKSGCNDYLSKPTPQKQLTLKLKKFLTEK